MRQRRWTEYMKDYEYTLLYNPGKENVVDDALSRKKEGILAQLMIKEWLLLEEAADYIFQES